ncbi:MAG: hypothetical protein ACYSUZ_06490, partial [Planctomycetota bacterium]
IRDRNFKDYNIALFLSYFKYVGYLAFPIQMTYRYPAMARFMAAHWATDAVHIVPVFGERGALFEHWIFCWIFCLFYNWPLTVRRRMQRISEIRASLSARIWHIPLAALAAVSIFAAAHYGYFTKSGIGPISDNKWYIKPHHSFCRRVVADQAHKRCSDLRTFHRSGLFAHRLQNGIKLGLGADAIAGAHGLACICNGNFLHDWCFGH